MQKCFYFFNPPRVAFFYPYGAMRPFRRKEKKRLEECDKKSNPATEAGLLTTIIPKKLLTNQHLSRRSDRFSNFV